MNNYFSLLRTINRSCRFALLVVVTAASFASLTTHAAPAPSTELTVTCPRAYPNPGEGAGVLIQIFSPTGIARHQKWYYCDEGRRYSTNVPGLGARVDYNCWNGYIATGSGSGAKGECVDKVTGLPIAKWTARLPRLPQYAAAMEACSLIGGTFDVPGVDVADFGAPPTGSVLLWTCNAWPLGLSPAPSSAAWGGYCDADGGAAGYYLLVTSNQPQSGLTGIACYQQPL